MGTSEFFHWRIFASTAEVSLSSCETISKVNLQECDQRVSSTMIAARTHDGQ